MKKLSVVISALLMSVMAWSQTPENPVVYQDCDRNGLNINYVVPHALSSDGTIQGHEYVDLGLPSGTKWATCNIGAETPEEDGSIFQWGGIIAGADGKAPHNNGTAWTKYCTYVAYGQVDDKTVLEAVDDAATYNWGNRWSVPTKEQWDELHNYCFERQTKRYGVAGIELQSKINGKRIFVKEYYNSGYATTDYYWTSTLNQDDNGKAYCVTYARGITWSNTSRARKEGSFIRPVCH